MTFLSVQNFDLRGNQITGHVRLWRRISIQFQKPPVTIFEVNFVIIGVDFFLDAVFSKTRNFLVSEILTLGDEF